MTAPTPIRPETAEGRTFKAGDVVKHGPTGETWTLACDQERDEIQWCGWPEGFAKAADCTLIKAASDEERMEMLEMVSKSRGDHGEIGWRASTAMHQLDASRFSAISDAEAGKEEGT